MIVFINLLAGLIFGFGLLLSGMANPAKVLNFLDLAGHWDPSLAFVMGGAVIVTAIGYRLIFRRAKPVLEEFFSCQRRARSIANLCSVQRFSASAGVSSGFAQVPHSSRSRSPRPRSSSSFRRCWSAWCWPHG